MEYLLIDAHQRFLGMMRSERELTVGDTFQGDNLQTYAVVGVNWSNQRVATLPRVSSQRQSLTVVAVQRALQTVEPLNVPI